MNEAKEPIHDRRGLMISIVKNQTFITKRTSKLGYVIGKLTEGNMRNKQVKQMIADVVLQGRKAVWYGEETEIFAALSEQHCEDEFGEGYFPQSGTFADSGIASRGWRYWWQPCAYEFDRSSELMKGGVVRNAHGDIEPNYQSLPLICGVYGSSNDVVQVSTSYN